MGRRSWPVVLLVLCAFGQDAKIDWKAAGDETAKLLAELVRIKTVNAPPDEAEIAQRMNAIIEKAKSLDDNAALGKFVREELALIEKLRTQRGNELELVNKVNALFRVEGVESEVLETAPGRGCLIARVRGTGSKRPLLIVAPVDVAPAEAADWTEADPFSGVTRNGYVYGRGSLQHKSMAACGIMTLLLLHRNKIRLSRDVVLLLAADGESGGGFGVKAIVKTHLDKIQAEFAIGEGGHIVQRAGKTFVNIQVAEKTRHRVKVTSSSMGSLGLALWKLELYRSTSHVTAVSREYFRNLAEAEPDEQTKNAMLDLASGQRERVERGAELLTAFADLVRNTHRPVVVKNGEAVLEVRLVPGQDLEAYAAELAKEIDRPEVKVVPELPKGERDLDSPASPVDSECFRALAKVAREMYPEAVVSPYLSPESSSSKTLRLAGIPTYGILPVPVQEEDRSRIRGRNERCPVEGIGRALEFLFRAVLELGRI